MTIETVTLGHLWTKSLKVTYDEHDDVIEICGVKYHAMIFRELGFGPIGRWIRIDGRSADGVQLMRGVTSEIEKEFDRMAGVE